MSEVGSASLAAVLQQELLQFTALVSDALEASIDGVNDQNNFNGRVAG